MEQVISRQKGSACAKAGMSTGFNVNSRNFRTASVRVSGTWGSVKEDWRDMQGATPKSFICQAEESCLHSQGKRVF